MISICPQWEGDDCPEDTKRFSEGPDKLQSEGAIAASVRGPSDWNSFIRIHREVLNISLDPPRDETDITQNKKIRQCVFAVLSRND